MAGANLIDCYIVSYPPNKQELQQTPVNGKKAGLYMIWPCAKFKVYLIVTFTIR